jgi:general nucleoside transport system permease protein
MSTPAGQLPPWADYGLLPLLNLLAAFLVAGLVVLFIGANPLEAVQVMIRGAFGYGEGIGYTLYYTTHFIFTGLCVAVAFHCGLFNIGGEGQAYLGGLGIALVCLALGDVLPWPLVAPLAIAGAMLFGALWALVPAWLQAYRGSHIVITTIMFNFIAYSLMNYLLVNVLSPRGSMVPETRTFGPGGSIPKLQEIFGPLGFDFGTAPVNSSLIIALVMAFLVWLLIWRTRFGFEMRATGLSPTAARYAGISGKRTIIITMLISGALAGMMALNPVLGGQHRLQLDLPAGAGFVGIAVALMGRSHPVGVVLAALLFGTLYQGGAALAFSIPQITRDMIVVIQALVILFAGALENMFRPALVRLINPPGRVRTAQV